VIVFGADERARVKKIHAKLSLATRSAYDQATTYHDGKWLYLKVNSGDMIHDVERLLAVKRKARPRTALAQHVNQEPSRAACVK